MIKQIVHGKRVIVTGPLDASLAKTFCEHRENYHACAEEHLLESLNSPFSPEQVAGQIIDLHCDHEAINFAAALAKDTTGNQRDKAALAEKLNRLRREIIAEVERRRKE